MAKAYVLNLSKVQQSVAGEMTKMGSLPSPKAEFLHGQHWTFGPSESQFLPPLLSVSSVLVLCFLPLKNNLQPCS